VDAWRSHSHLYRRELRARLQYLLMVLSNEGAGHAQVVDSLRSKPMLRHARRLFPFIERIFADGGYAGRKMALTICAMGAASGPGF
jgi:hypothetical protein